MAKSTIKQHGRTRIHGCEAWGSDAAERHGENYALQIISFLSKLSTRLCSIRHSQASPSSPPSSLEPSGLFTQRSPATRLMVRDGIFHTGSCGRKDQWSGRGTGVHVWLGNILLKLRSSCIVSVYKHIQRILLQVHINHSMMFWRITGSHSRQWKNINIPLTFFLPNTISTHNPLKK